MRRLCKLLTVVVPILLSNMAFALNQEIVPRSFKEDHCYRLKLGEAGPQALCAQTFNCSLDNRTYVFYYNLNTNTDDTFLLSSCSLENAHDSESCGEAPGAPRNCLEESSRHGVYGWEKFIHDSPPVYNVPVVPQRRVERTTGDAAA